MTVEPCTVDRGDRGLTVTVTVVETVHGPLKGGLTRGNGLQGPCDPVSTLRTLSTLLTLSLRGAL